MKIFISWSGPHSLGVALALRKALPNLFDKIELFVSSEDIRKGKRWRAEVSKELEASNFGIACLTPDNLEADWLHFEAGALTKSVKESSLYTFLVGLRPGDVSGPLSEFQHTTLDKEEVFKLIASINEAYGESKQAAERLRTLFDKFWWKDLEEAITNLPHPKKADKKPNSDEMLYEVLEITRQMARNVRNDDARAVAEVRLIEIKAHQNELKRLSREIETLRAELRNSSAAVVPVEDPQKRFLDTPLTALLLPEDLLKKLYACNIVTLGGLMKKIGDLLTIGFSSEEINTIREAVQQALLQN